MKKILFISNISNKITNFSLPSIYAAKKLGYQFHMAANYSNFNDDPEKYGVKLHHIDLDRNPFSKQNITAYKQMLELIEKEKFDVIHCNTPVGGVLGRLCGKKAGVPKVIYTAHGFHFYKGASFINRTLFKWVEIYLAKYTDALITINNEDYVAAQKFKLKGNGKVFYIPGVGVETSYIKDAHNKRNEIIDQIRANNDDCLLISIGELNSNKNNVVIIEALRILNNPSIHYLICGIGEKEKELKEKVKEYSLENNIHFLGFRNDIPELLKSSDIFLLPSYREGLSRSLMEAMASGLPCVVSNIRGNTDLISNEIGGYLHSPGNFEEISKALLNLSNDNQLKYKMGQFNQNKIKMYDIKNTKKEMLKIYKNVLSDV